MSDSPDEPQVPFGFFVDLGKAADQHQQQHQVAYHEMMGAITEFPIDTLNFFRGVLGNCEGERASYFVGLIDGIRYNKGYCQACDSFHDASEIFDSETRQPEDAPSGPVLDPNDRTSPTGDQMEADAQAAVLADMERYGLVVNPDAGKYGESKLLCENCRMQYSSLADRMLRSPGAVGCEGCQHKAKFG